LCAPRWATGSRVGELGRLGCAEEALRRCAGPGGRVGAWCGWWRCEPLPQEGEQPVEEELPGVSVEVEPVLVIHWRLVPGGEEERLGFGWRTSCRS
jgi:hypothetical protein